MLARHISNENVKKNVYYYRYVKVTLSLYMFNIFWEN